VSVKIRLKRMGAKKRPFYRVVVADARSPRDGRFIESVGYYDPLKNPKVFHVDDERIRHWMATGARPSDAVRELLERQGTLPATAHPVRTKIGPKRAPKPGLAPRPAAASAATAAESEGATAEAAPAAADLEEEPAQAAPDGVGEGASSATAAVDEPAPEGGAEDGSREPEPGDEAPAAAAEDEIPEGEADEEKAPAAADADSEG